MEKTIESVFEKQLSEAQPLTEDGLEKLNVKTYFNGEDIKVGDVILHALIITEETFNENGSKEFTMKLVCLNETHLDQYEIDLHHNSKIPIIKKKI